MHQTKQQRNASPPNKRVTSKTLYPA